MFIFLLLYIVVFTKFPLLSQALREKNNIKYLSLCNSRIDGEKFKSLLSCFYAPLPVQQKELKESKEPKQKDKRN